MNKCLFNLKTLVFTYTLAVLGSDLFKTRLTRVYVREGITSDTEIYEYYILLT